MSPFPCKGRQGFIFLGRCHAKGAKIRLVAESHATAAVAAINSAL